MSGTLDLETALVDLAHSRRQRRQQEEFERILGLVKNVSRDDRMRLLVALLEDLTNS